MAPDTGTVEAACQIDAAYEFDAPKFFDFINEETEEVVRAAEAWFQASVSYAPSRKRLLLTDRPRPPSSSRLP
jgi:targeting protein for Xklp2